MKKIFAALVLFSMIFSLTSCGVGEERVDWSRVSTDAIQEAIGKHIKNMRYNVYSVVSDEEDSKKGIKNLDGSVEFENEKLKNFKVQFDYETKKLLKLEIDNSPVQIFEKPASEVKKVETPIVEDDDTKIEKKLENMLKNTTKIQLSKA